MARDINGNSVQLSTFLKWNVGGTMGWETEVEDGKEMVVNMHCKVCARHVDAIRKNAKIKGQIQREVEVFAMGTKNVKKYAVSRHMAGLGHQAALDLDKLLGKGNDDDYYGEEVDDDGHSGSCDFEFGSGSGTQPRIDTVLANQSRDAYKKLFTCANNIATTGLPMMAFTTMVQTLKDVGVQLISGCDSPQRCSEFIGYIAEEERRRIKIIITDATSFSVLSDGSQDSQARKTGSEKELIFIRACHNGTADYFCTALQDMDDYGAATANNIKQCIDDTFLVKLGVDEDDYGYGLVSASADGAAVNTGAHSGLFTQLQASRPWMINIHCVSHRVELAIKDSLMDKASPTVNFNQVLQFLISLFYLMKKSPKVQRIAAKTAETLNVQVYKTKKVHGTRFVNHQRLGLKCLLNNWIVYLIAFEDIIAEKKNTTQKLPGILAKLRNVRFLVLCVYYKSILDILSELSLQFERGDVAAFDVLPEIEKTLDKVDNLIDDETDFGRVLSESGISYDPDTNSISKSLLKRGHNRKKLCNREYKTVEYSGMMKENGVNANAAVHGVSSKILPKVKECLTKRFSSFEQQVFKDMMWMNPQTWNDDDVTAEVESIVQLAEHFEREPAEYHIDTSKIKREWKSLRITVKHYYSKLSAKQLWKKILTYRRVNYPNICKLAEAVLCLGPSNSTVEAGFSHLTAMLVDRRLSMSHKSMEDNLIVKVNNKVFTSQEMEEILEEALDSFLSSKKRKMKLATENASNNKRSKMDHEESDDDVEVVESGICDDELSGLSDNEADNYYYEEYSADYDLLWADDHEEASCEMGMTQNCQTDPVTSVVLHEKGSDFDVVESLLTSLVDSACLCVPE